MGKRKKSKFTVEYFRKELSKHGITWDWKMRKVKLVELYQRHVQVIDEDDLLNMTSIGTLPGLEKIKKKKKDEAKEKSENEDTETQTTDQLKDDKDEETEQMETTMVNEEEDSSIIIQEDSTITNFIKNNNEAVVEEEEEEEAEKPASAKENMKINNNNTLIISELSVSPIKQVRNSVDIQSILGNFSHDELSFLNVNTPHVVVQKKEEEKVEEEKGQEPPKNHKKRPENHMEDDDPLMPSSPEHPNYQPVIAPKSQKKFNHDAFLKKASKNERKKLANERHHQKPFKLKANRSTSPKYKHYNKTQRYSYQQDSRASSRAHSPSFKKAKYTSSSGRPVVDRHFSTSTTTSNTTPPTTTPTTSPPPKYVPLSRTQLQERAASRFAQRPKSPEHPPLEKEMPSFNLYQPPKALLESHLSTTQRVNAQELDQWLHAQIHHIRIECEARKRALQDCLQFQLSRIPPDIRKLPLSQVSRWLDQSFFRASSSSANSGRHETYRPIRV